MVTFCLALFAISGGMLVDGYVRNEIRFTFLAVAPILGAVSMVIVTLVYGVSIAATVVFVAMVISILALSNLD